MKFLGSRNTKVFVVARFVAVFLATEVTLEAKVFLDSGVLTAGRIRPNFSALFRASKYQI